MRRIVKKSDRGAKCQKNLFFESKRSQSSENRQKKILPIEQAANHKRAN